MNKPNSPESSGRRIDDIEILRGIAVLFVVIQHLRGTLITAPHPLLERLAEYFGLWTGVDIFFAISGFVIVRQLLPKLSAAKTSGQISSTVLSFWLQRAWRLFPSAWLWLALILVAAAFFNHSAAFGSFRANYDATIAAVLQVANFRFAYSWDTYEYGASFAYWSLSLEEQFYLLLPLLILLSGRWFVWALVVIVAGQFFMERGLWGLALRTDGLALGALLAIWQQRPSYRLVEPTFMKNAYLRWVVVGIILLFIASLGSDHTHVVSFRCGLIALLAALLVFFASYDRQYLRLPRPLQSVLLWVGSRSYAIYLIHVPAYLLAREILFRLTSTDAAQGSGFGWQLLLTAMAILVGASELNYRCIEIPCRNYGKAVARRRFSIAAAATEPASLPSKT